MFPSVAGCGSDPDTPTPTNSVTAVELPPITPPDGATTPGPQTPTTIPSPTDPGTPSWEPALMGFITAYAPKRGRTTEQWRSDVQLHTSQELGDWFATTKGPTTTGEYLEYEPLPTSEPGAVAALITWDDGARNVAYLQRGGAGEWEVFAYDTYES